MSQFKQVKEAYVITCSRGGIYRELDIFKYNNELYAKAGTGFIKLNEGSRTSSDTIRWSLIVGVEYKISTLGRLNYVRLAK